MKRILFVSLLFVLSSGTAVYAGSALSDRDVCINNANTTAYENTVVNYFCKNDDMAPSDPHDMYTTGFCIFTDNYTKGSYVRVEAFLKNSLARIDYNESWTFADQYLKQNDAQTIVLHSSDGHFWSSGLKLDFQLNKQSLKGAVKIHDWNSGPHGGNNYNVKYGSDNLSCEILQPL